MAEISARMGLYCPLCLRNIKKCVCGYAGGPAYDGREVGDIGYSFRLLERDMQRALDRIADLEDKFRR